MKYRPIPGRVVDFLKSVPEGQPMHVLRTAVSMLSLYDPEANDMSPESNHPQGAEADGADGDHRHHLRPASQKAASRSKAIRSSGLAANFLYTLTGKRPDDVMERAFDIALTLHADHELNASTFAGRVTAATLSDIYSAVTAAIGALKGPLHGGANEDVIKFLLEVDANTDAAVQEVREQALEQR